MTEEEAKTKLTPPVQRGSSVTVVRGRKVPRGTLGVVRWEGDGEWGPRVGLSVEGQEKLVYTALKNVEAVYPGLSPGQRPEEGWVRLAQRVDREQRLPIKGHRVRHKTTLQEGVVFWVEDSRVGFKAVPHPKGHDGTMWADACDLLRLLPCGEDDNMTVEHEYNVVIPARPFVPETIKAKGAAGLPHPFCDIRLLEPTPDGQFRALTETGQYIATIPADAAQRFLE